MFDEKRSQNEDNAPQNETQFKILKIFTDWPGKKNLKKLSQLFKVSMGTIAAVQASPNYTSYLETRLKNRPDPFMQDFFGMGGGLR